MTLNEWLISKNWYKTKLILRNFENLKGKQLLQAKALGFKEGDKVLILIVKTLIKTTYNIKEFSSTKKEPQSWCGSDNV